MQAEIFSGFGCSIVQREKRYFVRYDSGGSASWDMEAEISVADVQKVQKSERDAHEVILAVERSGGGKRIMHQK